MREQLDAALEFLVLPLDEGQKSKLLAYLTLFAKWNAAYNLSAIKDPQQMLVKHLFDCLSVVNPIYAQLTHGLSTDEKKILDVGSGGGLPGVVLAICLPDTQITMVDAVQKKMIFVRQAIAELALNNAAAYGARIQDWEQTYPVITARAWTALGDIPKLAGHCLSSGGSVLAMKGPRLAQELQELPVGWSLASVLDVTVPQLNEARTLAYIQRA